MAAPPLTSQFRAAIQQWGLDGTLCVPNPFPADLAVTPQWMHACVCAQVAGFPNNDFTAKNAFYLAIAGDNIGAHQQLQQASGGNNALVANGLEIFDEIVRARIGH